MKNLNYTQWILVLFLILLTIFVFQNLQEVSIKYIIFEMQVPLFLVILVSFWIGVFSGRIFNEFLPKKQVKK